MEECWCVKEIGRRRHTEDCRRVRKTERRRHTEDCRRFRKTLRRIHTLECRCVKETGGQGDKRRNVGVRERETVTHEGT